MSDDLVARLRKPSPRCADCGRFLSYAEVESGETRFYFEPASHFGPEVTEWTCARCVARGGLPRGGRQR
jgi:hypothetical protein